jgi:alanyl-tRNA synthetase
VQSNEIRRRFLAYFGERGHEIVPSSGIVPANDPTLYFTNAGMVQFKDVFTGREARESTRATSAQKCLRVSGKHNDLENVGRTPRHHTLFEMLGNFSFGDYFKPDAIAWAWELLTDVFGLDVDRLWITVFEEDDEAEALWKAVPGVRPERIQRLGAKDNFWSMGDTGPCGPCSEIFYDHGPAYGPEGGPATESDRYVEIWNLVFMQFERAADGTMAPLPRPSIDTGAGLERVAAAMQGVYSNYDTDCFTPLLAVVSRLADTPYGRTDSEADVAMRVIADHARATAFAIGDGVMPGNSERDYVLRRIMRRAIRFGVKLGLNGPFLHEVTDAVVEQMGEAYPDLVARRDFIREVVRGEEERFSRTLGRGLELLEGAIDAAGEGGTLEGDTVFRLYDTFGFPVDLTELIAEERGLSVDHAGYEAAMQAQREAGRANWKGSGEERVADVFHALSAEHGPTAFTGYDHDHGPATILAIVHDGATVGQLTAGQSGAVVVNQTPFYAESGGQVGDTGAIEADGIAAAVSDTRKLAGDLFVHDTTVDSGTLRVGDPVQLAVDASRRDRTRLNHTATHLLHAALREVLGDHVTQKGSMVSPVRLRFDFAHHKSVTEDELAAVEDRVGQWILNNVVVEATERTLDEARAAGAMALFGEKYGDVVRTIEVPGFSLELCGGTHVARTGDIGLFRVLTESGVAAGVRRIEAVTGPGALAWLRTRDRALRAAALALRTQPEQVVDGIERVLEDRRRLERELDGARRELARAAAGDVLDQVREIDGMKVLSAEITADAKALRDEADRLRDKLGSGVVVLGSRDDGSVKLVVTVSKDLAGKRVHAGKLIRIVAGLVGGGGGGRPDMAQAGGRDPDALPGALEQVYTLVQG